MGHSAKTFLAAKFADYLRAYGVGLLRDARAVENDGAEPSVRGDMKDGLSLLLPFEFDVAHFDSLIGVPSGDTFPMVSRIVRRVPNWETLKASRYLQNLTK